VTVVLCDCSAGGSVVLCDCSVGGSVVLCDCSVGGSVDTEMDRLHLHVDTPCSKSASKKSMFGSLERSMDRLLCMLTPKKKHRSTPSSSDEPRTVKVNHHHWHFYEKASVSRQNLGTHPPKLPSPRDPDRIAVFSAVVAQCDRPVCCRINALVNC